MSIETRIATARAALVDTGRPDLATRLLSASATRAHFPSAEPPVAWESSGMGDDDRVLMFRAAAVASLAEGYDEPGLWCEPCLRRQAKNCQLVTRRQFLSRQSCGADNIWRNT